MSRPSPLERTAAAEALGKHWRTLLQDFGSFADAAPESSAARLGRMESYRWLAEWPDRVFSQAARERERALRPTNGAGR